MYHMLPLSAGGFVIVVKELDHIPGGEGYVGAVLMSAFACFGIASAMRAITLVAVHVEAEPFRMSVMPVSTLVDDDVFTLKSIGSRPPIGDRCSFYELSPRPTCPFNFRTAPPKPQVGNR